MGLDKQYILCVSGSLLKNLRLTLTSLNKCKELDDKLD